MLAALQRGGAGQPGHGLAGVGMDDGHAQRVGGIGAGQAGQLEQAAHHFLHLGLGRAAMADHGLFHLQRGVLGHWQVARHQRGDTRPARLAQQQGGLRVDVDEDDFDRRHVGLVPLGDFTNAVKQHFQPPRQVAQIQVRGLDGAAAHITQA